MSAEAEGYRTRSGAVLAYGKWHRFGPDAPTAYRVTGVKRQTFSVMLLATKEVAKPAGPAGRDALMMAMYREERAESYEYYAFGPRLDAAPQEIMA